MDDFGQLEQPDGKREESAAAKQMGNQRSPVEPSLITQQRLCVCREFLFHRLHYFNPPPPAHRGRVAAQHSIARKMEHSPQLALCCAAAPCVDTLLGNSCFYFSRCLTGKRNIALTHSVWTGRQFSCAYKNYFLRTYQ